MSPVFSRTPQEPTIQIEVRLAGMLVRFLIVQVSIAPQPKPGLLYAAFHMLAAA